MSQTVKVKGYGRAVFPDHFTKEQMRTALRKKFNSAAESTAGALDAAATVGSAVVAEPVSGLAGIGSSIYNMDASKGADTVKAVQDAMTYQPRTAKGQEYLQNVSEFVEPAANLIGSASQNLGDKAYAATGSPTLAAAAYSVPTAIAEGIGLKGLNIARKPVSKADLYTPRIFAGATARTADLDKLNKAKAMASQGVDAESIYKQTGWFQEQGDWKFEIDDSKAYFNGEALGDANGYRVGDILNHEDLLMAYPQLSDIKIKPSTNMSAYDLGSFNGDTIELNKAPPNEIIAQLEASIRNRMDVNSPNHILKRAERDVADGEFDTLEEAIEENEKWLQYDKDELASLKTRYWSEQDLSTSLHELQHAIQGIENFPVGGSPSMARGAAYKAFGESDPKYSGTEGLAAYMNDYQWIKGLQNLDLYRRLMGEVEARRVERRLRMSEQDRIDNFPGTDIDVPMSQLIPYRETKK